MTTTSIVPGTEHFIDDPDSGQTYPLPSATLVGSEPVFSDGSDGSYADMALVISHPLGNDYTSGREMYAQIAAAPLTTIGFSAAFRASQTMTDQGWADAALAVVIVDNDGGGFADSNFGNNVRYGNIPNLVLNSGFTDYTVDMTTWIVNTHGTSLADVVALVAAGDAWLATFVSGGATNSLFPGKSEVLLSEFSLFDSSAPIRLHPLDDEHGIYSAPRLYPPARSNRLYGGPP